MNVTVVGSGYVGLVVGACLAETGNQVVCADIDARKIGLLKEGRSPIYEPGLDRLLQRNLSEGRIRFTTDVAQAVGSGRVVFIAVGTPPDEDGSADLKHVLAVARVIGENLVDEKVVITKSTVPVGTASKVREEIEKHTNGKFHVCSNPEFLKEGAAIDDFMRPDRVVCGIESEEARPVLEELYEPFVRSGNPLIFMDIASAELTKYAANAMLATRISFMNQIAALCEAAGADVTMVRKGVGSDPRIGPSFLYAGAGYGGSCFPKDVRALIQTGEEMGIDLSILKEVHETNERQKRVLGQKIRSRFGEDLSGLSFAVWGLAFKPETDDMRDSPSLAIIPNLVDKGATIHAHDPQGVEEAKKLLPRHVVYFDDVYDAVSGADAVVLLTEWNEYRGMDLAKLRSLVRGNTFVDLRNVYDRDKVSGADFDYHCIGR